ncbi:hypothetical protein HY950_03020 [Candidatus Gottesmanbacteria bacterium]|nr:hypothetical protein [Candidatus Gottesmanbacteria bacterium]
MPGIQPKEGDAPQPQGIIEEPRDAMEGPQSFNPTLIDLDVSDQFQPQKMYVITHGRGMQHTYLGDDNAEDPAKRQCPTGGCSDNKSLYKDIYNDLFKQQVAKTPTINLQDKAQRREIHMKVVDILRPQVRENRKYVDQDKKGPQMAEGPEFTLKDGKIFYPNFGKTLQEMYRDQKRLRPHEYDAREHATMTLMEKALVNGAKRVSHVSHNKDTKGNEAIRDQITMVWDEKEQRGQMIIERIAQDGRFLSMEEAREVMQKKSSGATEVDFADGVFIFTDKPPAREEIQIITAPYDVTDGSIQQPYHDHTEADYEPVDEPVHILKHHNGDRFVYDDTAEERARISDHIIADTIHTAEYVTRSLQQEFELLISNLRHFTEQDVQKKPIVLPQFLQRLLGRPLAKQETDMVTQNEEMLWRSTEQGQELLKTVQETWEGMDGARELITFAVEPEIKGIAIPAAIFALDILAHPEMMLVEDAQAIGEEEREIPLTEKEREAFREILPVESTQETETTSNIELIDITVLTWVKELIQRVDDIPAEQAIEIVEHEEEVVVLQMSELWDALADRASEVPLVVLKDEETRETIEREHVENFSLAITVWLLLKLDGYYRSLQSLKLTLIEGTKQGSLIEKLKEHMPEGLVQREPAPWVLFAIIWYLAQLRESGVQNTKYQRPNTTKKSTRNKKLFLPHGGVIFAYAT